MRGQRNSRIKVSVVILILVLFMVGSGLGAFVETGIDEGVRTGALQYVDSILKENGAQGDNKAVFKDAVKSNGMMLLIMAVGGLTVFLFPVAVAVIIYKGAALGFTSALMMEGDGGKGVVECCVALLPQNFILIPLFVIYGYFTVCMAMNVLCCKNKRYRLRIYVDNIKVYLLVSVFSAGVLCIGAAVEGYINPLLSGII